MRVFPDVDTPWGLVREPPSVPLLPFRSLVSTKLAL